VEGQAMKGVIWILACVVLVGCESRRLDTRTVESSGGVTRELATVVRRALETKRVEEDRLVQYAAEKQRLVSRLMPNGDWADGQRNTGGREVPTARQTGRAKRRGKPQRGKKGTRQGTKSRELPQEWGVARENGELDNVRIVAISPGWV
jgi:hypothetical protein